MTKTSVLVLAIGLALPACSPQQAAPPPPPAPVAKPAPPPPPPAPAAAPAVQPIGAMAAANALFDAEKYAEARKAFEAITKEQPKNAEAWFKLGYCLHVTGDLDQAIVVHSKAAEFPEVRAEALYNLGCAQALKGNADAAFEALNKSIDSGFAELKILQEDADLKSLRADPRYAALVERLKPKPEA